MIYNKTTWHIKSNELIDVYFTLIYFAKYVNIIIGTKVEVSQNVN